MKHYGDITKIHGDAVEIVDIITGGSPCQDLSVAGRRAGLDGERSGLFMEQVRIVKEMREHDVRTNGRAGQFIRPRYMVWENVQGALSSPGKRNGEDHRGEDFQAVLSEIVKVVKADAPDVPLPENRRWPHAGCLMGIGDNGQPFSIAWRIHDAQFWGLPQRRKRIALVADFGGLSAAEILFERKGLSRDSEPCEEEEQGIASASEESIGAAISFQERAGCAGGGKGILIQNERTGALSTLNNQSVCCGVDVYNQNFTGEIAASVTAAAGGTSTSGPKVMVLNDQGDQQMLVSADKTGTLRSEEHWHQPIVYGISAYESNAMKSPNPHSGVYAAETARTLDENGGSPACNQGGMAVLMDASYYKGTGAINGKERTVVCVGNGQLNQMSMAEQANTLDTMHDQQAILCGNPWDPQSEKVYHGDGAWHTLCAGERGGQQRDATLANSVVRRLTPLECERLQGYPDGWTDIGEWTDSKGKKHKDADSSRYKALGNSIALPFWAWMARRICAQYERPMTMASLFDGISGFPLVFARAGCKPVWTSEIEEFAIAVCKKHFGDKNKEGDLWKYLFQ